MVNNYSSLNSNATVGFSKNSEGKIGSVIDFKTMKTSLFLMILVLLNLVTDKSTSISNKSNPVINSSFTYHAHILKSFVADGHSGGYFYAFFSPTDHDIPISYQIGITFKTTNKFLKYSNTHTSTNIKTIQS